jgi:hypothetical protein
VRRIVSGAFLRRRVAVPRPAPSFPESISPGQHVHTAPVPSCTVFYYYSSSMTHSLSENVGWGKCFFQFLPGPILD